MFEFLFCPQHGLLRVENVAWAVAYAGNFFVWIGFWVRHIADRVRGWFQWA